MNRWPERVASADGEFVPLLGQEVLTPQSEANLALGDSAEPISQALPLFVDPAFRTDRAERTYGLAYWSVGILGLVGLVIIGAIASTMADRRAVSVATSVSFPIPRGDTSQTIVPLVPNIENAAPAAGPPRERAAEDATSTPPPSQPIASRKRVRQVHHMREPTTAAPLAMRSEGPPIDAADLPPLPDVGPTEPQAGN